MAVDQLRLRLVIAKLIAANYIAPVDAITDEGRAVCVTFPGLIEAAPVDLPDLLSAR